MTIDFENIDIQLDNYRKKILSNLNVMKKKLFSKLYFIAFLV